MNLIDPFGIEGLFFDAKVIEGSAIIGNLFTWAIAAEVIIYSESKGVGVIVDGVVNEVPHL